MSEVNTPLVTIGILTKNRFWCIRKVLEAIESLEYPKDKINLVFVDNHSTDGTFEILAEWKSEMEGRYYNIILIQEHTNIPQARNLCIEKMVGKYLLFWDSDVVPPRDLLKEMVFIMENNLSLGIIGADYIYEAALKIKRKLILNKKSHATYMGFTLIRRDVFEKVGGFNENLSGSEDTEFCIRVVEKTNYKIMWSPKPVLHLKRLEDVKRKGLVKSWVKYNFVVRAEEYYRIFGSLPKFLKARIFYYLGLPWAVVASFIGAIINGQFLAIVLLIYLAPSIYLVIKQNGLKDGMVTWLRFNFPIGLALSYGVLKVAIKRHVLTHKKTFMRL